MFVRWRRVMKLTAKTKYAVTAMADLLLHANQGFISLSDISARQNISVSYLGHLFADMAKSKLVESQRGPGGGYRLSKNANQISLADIIISIDEGIDNRRCAGKQNCQNNEICLTHSLWEEINQRVKNVFSQIYLSDVIEYKNVTSVMLRQDKLMTQKMTTQ